MSPTSRSVGATGTDCRRTSTHKTRSVVKCEQPSPVSLRAAETTLAVTTLPSSQQSSKRVPRRVPRVTHPGIRRTPYGWQAHIRVTVTDSTGLKTKRYFSKRFPPDTTDATMLVWRTSTRNATLVTAKTARHTKALFAADATRYLAAVQAMPTYRDRERDIGEWVDVFGERTRANLTSTEIRTHLQRWRASGLAAATCTAGRPSCTSGTSSTGRPTPTPSVTCHALLSRHQRVGACHWRRCAGYSPRCLGET